MMSPSWVTTQQPKATSGRDGEGCSVGTAQLF